MAGHTDGDDVASRTVAASTGQFSSRFLEVVANDNPGNLITSPLSAQVVLAMAAYGARGTTAAQMRSTLFIPSDDEFGQSGYQSIIESFNAVKGVDLRLANKMFTACKFAVKSTYKELTAKKFLSASHEVDFDDPVSAATTINTWCEEQTNKRITDVLSPDDLTPDTKLVLVNAVYFKGQWANKFHAFLTEDRPFHVDEKTIKNVPTMSIENKFRSGDLPQLHAKFLEIPYEGDQLSMIIILPNEVNGLKIVKENLHELNLRETLQQTSPKTIQLYLPKFKIESNLNLEQALQKLGITDMFENGADFSGIADTPLKISKVIQKAFIEVNEEGSEAAAVTAMVAVAYSMSYYEPPPQFEVDRPYYYAIYHRDTGISLFTGIVEQPNFA